MDSDICLIPDLLHCSALSVEMLTSFFLLHFNIFCKICLHQKTKPLQKQVDFQINLILIDQTLTAGDIVNAQISNDNVQMLC